ncbi:4Fe-4S ferredoxin [Candidatus Aerophobetes bacterium Ae_b3a]|nr:MAG: 4Fe-4S ferredoxin [Candidatus Aerophobetes bacterium Ae_b3a]
MSKVYFKKVDSSLKPNEISNYTRGLVDTLLKRENVELKQEIPLKVHFGERGNTTFINPEYCSGIIDYIENQNKKAYFIETNILYGGERTTKQTHIKLAKEHGFTRIPVIIADGEKGEDYYQVEINKKHFAKCKIGKEFSKYSQIIVVSHFTGQMLAGFAGAIKNLAMGFASRGGKLAQHAKVIKPRIKNRACDKCRLCEKRCAVNAITIGKKSYIDYDKCISCAACNAICPKKAIKIILLRSIFNIFGNPFRERLVEGAYAAQKDKKIIYVTFAMNITRGCDCDPKTMKPIVEDIGILASTDPVAIDQACYDMVKTSGKKLRGRYMLKYAEEIGMGSRNYQIVKEDRPLSTIIRHFNN